VKPVALIESNVWVSALFNPNSPPARLMNAWLQGAFEVVIALPVLAEIAEVLKRPRIKSKYGIREEEIVQYLQLIAARAAITSVAGQMAICRDLNDDIVLEVTIAGGTGFLVTRADDLKRDLELLQRMQEHGIQVVRVSQFLTILSTMTQ
jgi:putative PIN family toxin of toxin-antitoxin system